MNLILSKTDNRIFRLLKLLLGACLFVPLLAWSGVIFPYTAPKAFAFRVLVELAAVFYFYLALKYPERFLPTLKKGGWGWGGFLNLSVFTFLVVNLLSAVFGADFYASWWGNLERMMGVWGLLHFVVFFFILSVVFRVDGSGKQIPPNLPLQREEKNKIPPFLKGGEGGFKDQDFSRQLMKISVAVSAVISLLAIGQHFFSLGDLLPRVDRVYATIGNAGFLGTYLIFNIFLAGYLFFVSSGKTKWLFAICGLLLAISLLLTGTRGAYLGLGAGAIVFLLLWTAKNFYFLCKDEKGLTSPTPLYKGGSLTSQPPFKRGARGVSLSVIILLTVIILIGTLFIMRNSDFVKDKSVLSRLTSFSLNDATSQSRLILWQDSWRAWQLKPLLGFGPENFEVAINKYLSPRLAGFEAYATDRSHNFIFDYGAAIGWLGLLGYLAMIGAVGWALWRLRKNNFVFFSVFTSLLVAYLVQNLFIFDSFVSYLMLFFVLALINSHFGKKRSSHPERNEGFWSFTKKFVLARFMIFIIFSLYSFNLKPLLAAKYANQILSLPPESATQAAPLLNDALSLDTFASPEIVYQVALDYITKISQNSALARNEDFYGVTSGVLEQAINQSPSRARNYIALAWLNLYFSGQDRQRIGEAISLGNKIKDLSPTKKDAYLILVAGYALSNQPQKAEEIISQVSVIDAKMGEEVREYWEKLR